MDDVDRERLLLALEPYCGHLISVADVFTLRGPEPDYVRKCLLVASLRKVSQQTKAIIMLSQSGFLEESTAVARMLIEAIVNATYLQTAEESEVDRFLKYDSQRMRVELVSSYLESGMDYAAAIEKEKLAVEFPTSGISEKAITWSARKLHERAKKADLNCNPPMLNKLQNTVSRVSNFAVHSTLISMIHLLPNRSQTDGFPQRQTLHKLCLQLVEQALKFFTDYAIKSAKTHLGQ